MGRSKILFKIVRNIEVQHSDTLFKFLIPIDLEKDFLGDFIKCSREGATLTLIYQRRAPVVPKDPEFVLDFVTD